MVKRGPLWTGPSGEGPNGGITFSALSRFLTCRERFRVKMIEGLAPNKKFEHRMYYGHMWHACEEALAGKKDWKRALVDYTQPLMKEFPLDREQVTHWMNVCAYQFPLYVDYWKKHPDVKNRTPLEQEEVFDVAYTLPSGRIVRLRGKRDSVDLIKKNGKNGVWLQENKSKGNPDESEIRRQLKNDLQTMMYLIALDSSGQYKEPIAGVRYNVIRRPLSGGKGTIKRLEGKQLKAGYKEGETWTEFYKRAAQYIIDEPEAFFMRWEFDVTEKDIEEFKRMTLNPILEQLCDWYHSITDFVGYEAWLNDKIMRAEYSPYLNYRHPFGCINTVDEYGWTEIDDYLMNGSMVGLKRADALFTELN